MKRVSYFYEYYYELTTIIQFVRKISTVIYSIALLQSCSFEFNWMAWEILPDQIMNMFESWTSFCEILNKSFEI